MMETLRECHKHKMHLIGYVCNHCSLKTNAISFFLSTFAHDNVRMSRYGRGGQGKGACQYEWKVNKNNIYERIRT